MTGDLNLTEINPKEEDQANFTLHANEKHRSVNKVPANV
jgi:hypothetical protein